MVCAAWLTRVAVACVWISALLPLALAGRFSEEPLPELPKAPPKGNTTNEGVESAKVRQGLPKGIKEILERHRRRQEERRKATPSPKEEEALRTVALDVIDKEFNDMLEITADSFARFVRSDAFDPNSDVSESTCVRLEEESIELLSEELEPRFERSQDLAEELFKKSKPWKKKLFVTDMKEHVPSYCAVQRERIWSLFKFHLTSPVFKADEPMANDALRGKLARAGKYIEGGIEDYLELSYYSNLALHGKKPPGASSTNVSSIKIGSRK